MSVNTVELYARWSEFSCTIATCNTINRLPRYAAWPNMSPVERALPYYSCPVSVPFICTSQSSGAQFEPSLARGGRLQSFAPPVSRASSLSCGGPAALVSALVVITPTHRCETRTPFLSPSHGLLFEEAFSNGNPATRKLHGGKEIHIGTPNPIRSSYIPHTDPDLL